MLMSQTLHPVQSLFVIQDVTFKHVDWRFQIFTFLVVISIETGILMK